MTWTLSIWIIFSFVFRGKGNSFQSDTLYRAKYGIYAELIHHTLETIYTVSVIKCCISCSRSASCFSVVYDSDSKQCMLLSKGISRAATKPLLPSNIQAFTKPLPACSDFGYKDSNGVSGSCYKANYTKKNKQDAADECANDQASLVQIDTFNKAVDVRSFIQSETTPAVGYFIDGSDEAIEDDWRLSDGRPLYLNWMPGEPALCCKNHEDCVAIFLSGLLNDIPCTATNAFICEKRTNVI